MTIIPYANAKRLHLKFTESALPKVAAFGGHDVPVVGIVDSITLANSNFSCTGRVLITSRRSLEWTSCLV